jgi:type I restriction enzyme S subunit
MACKWEKMTLGECIKLEGGSILTGPFGTLLRAAEYSPTGVPVVSVSEVGFGRILVKGHTPRVNESVTTRLPKYLLKEGDIVFARKGAGTAVERSALVVAEQSGWFLGSDGIRVRLPRSAYPLFVSLSLRSVQHRNWMRQHAVGTTMPALNEGIIRRIPLTLPPLPEQKRIAHILSALDDKIELNRRMNATLEAMSRAIFKSWFVDFDSVRSKAAGRQPEGMDAETAALFPDSFEESEIGEVPKGWRCGRLDDAIVLQRGFDLPANARTAGIYPVLAAGGFNGRHNTYMVRGPGVTTGRSGVLGKVYFVHEDFWPLNTSLWVKEYKASSPLHAYHMLSLIDLSVFNAGSAVPTLNRNHVHSLPTVLAGPHIIQAFDAVIAPFFTANRLREAESRTVATLRDTLLPKLLSGEVRVPEAERAVEEAIG